MFSFLFNCFGMFVCVCVCHTVVTQFYITEAENEYVIRQNAAIMKCKIPSFTSDFVYVEAWISDDGTVLMAPNHTDPSASYGYCSCYFPYSSLLLLFFFSSRFCHCHHFLIYFISKVEV